MQLMRRQQSWNPFRELEELSSRFNQLFGLTRWPGNGEREALALTDWTPAVNIRETDKEYRIEAELPNMRKEDIQVTLENGVLAIQGDRKEEKEEKGVKYHRQELSYGHFLRSFTMPDDADESKIKATFKDGILHLVIGKSKEKVSSVREIAIS